MTDSPSGPQERPASTRHYHDACKDPPCFASLWKVVVIQAQNALNDKIAQYVLLGLAAVTPLLSAAQKETYAHLGAALLAIPLLLFAPLAGWLSDRYSKRSVLFWCSTVQFFGMVAIAIAFYFNLFWTATFCFFILAFQATIFSPAKGGIVKELVGERHLSYANSWTQATGLVAMVAGPWLGGALFKWFASAHKGEEHLAAFWPMMFLAVAALVPVIFSLRVRPTPPHSAEPLRWGMLWEHFLHLGDLFRARTLRLTAMGVAFFWFAATLLALLLVQVAQVKIPLQKEAQAELGGFLLVWVGLGIAAGSVIVGLISTNKIELGLVPLGGLGMAVGCWAVAAPFVPLGEWLFCVIMFFMGLASAVFLVPLNAFLQDLVEPEKRGRQLSAAALLDSLGMCLGIFMQWLWRKMGLEGIWGARLQFVLLGLLCLVTAVYVVRFIPQNFLRFVLLALVKLIYRVRVSHAARIPKEGGVLMLANHVSYIDAFIVSAATERTVRFIAADQFYHMKWIGPFLKLFNAVPVSPKKAKDAIVSVSDAVKEGSVVCIFPEGQITRTGMLNEIRKGFELIARRGQSPVVPVYLDDLWGSVFSFERNRYFWKWPKRFAYCVSVGFGEAVPAEQATSDWARQQFRELAAEAIAARGEIRPLLEVAVTRSLARRPWLPCLLGGKTQTRGMVLSLARLLARRWRNRIPGPRVGILLEGREGILANLALRLAGFVPVNLNLPRDSLTEALTEHRIHAIVGKGSALAHPGIQWLEFNQELSTLDTFQLALEILATYFLPRSVQAWRAKQRRPQETSDSEAVAWIAADGTGAAKFESLTHKELLCQCEQLSNTGLCADEQRFMSHLPSASIAGTVAALWHPLLHGARRITEDSHAHQATLHLARVDDAPLLATALADPARKTAHKKPPTIVAFGADPTQLLENTSHPGVFPSFTPSGFRRILTVSLPDPPLPNSTAETQRGHRERSLGRLLPGFRVCSEAGALRFISPDGVDCSIENAQLDVEDFLTQEDLDTVRF